jgi:putative transposase
MTTYDPRKHHRRSIRLPGHDYAAGGAYFLTTCVVKREPLFGRIMSSEMILNGPGYLVERAWHSLPQRFPRVVSDALQIMPNHLHGILVIPGSGLEPALAAATGAPIIELFQAGACPGLEKCDVRPTQGSALQPG